MIDHDCDPADIHIHAQSATFGEVGRCGVCGQFFCRQPMWQPMGPQREVLTTLRWEGATR